MPRNTKILIAVAILVIVLAAIFITNAENPPEATAPAGEQIEGFSGISVGER